MHDSIRDWLGHILDKARDLPEDKRRIVLEETRNLSNVLSDLENKKDRSTWKARLTSF